MKTIDISGIVYPHELLKAAAEQTDFELKGFTQDGLGCTIDNCIALSESLVQRLVGCGDLPSEGLAHLLVSQLKFMDMLLLEAIKEHSRIDMELSNLKSGSMEAGK